MGLFEEYTDFANPIKIIWGRRLLPSSHVLFPSSLPTLSFLIPFHFLLTFHLSLFPSLASHLHLYPVNPFFISTIHCHLSLFIFSFPHVFSFFPVKMICLFVRMYILSHKHEAFLMNDAIINLHVQIYGSLACIWHML